MSQSQLIDISIFFIYTFISKNTCIGIEHLDNQYISDPLDSGQCKEEVEWQTTM